MKYSNVIIPHGVKSHATVILIFTVARISDIIPHFLFLKRRKVEVPVPEIGASCSAAFTRTPDTHWIRSSVRPRAGLDAVVK
jgi:hypothetical protein